MSPGAQPGMQLLLQSRVRPRLCVQDCPLLLAGTDYGCKQIRLSHSGKFTLMCQDAEDTNEAKYFAKAASLSG